MGDAIADLLTRNGVVLPCVIRATLLPWLGHIAYDGVFAVIEHPQHPLWPPPRSADELGAI
eukprot:gene56446-2409_t